MHGISLVPDGDVFLKVLPSKVPKLSITTELEGPTAACVETDACQPDDLPQNITIEEAEGPRKLQARLGQSSSSNA